MYSRSYGNVRGLMVSGSKEPQYGNGGVQIDRAFPPPQGERRPTPGSDGNTKKREANDQYRRVKENEMRREGP
jgi:hypothetical protein